MNTPSIERHAIDRLLLAIIDGYPDEHDLASATWRARRLQRLQEARKALFADVGDEIDRSDHEIAALKMMAIWFERDTQLRAMRNRDPTCFPTVTLKSPVRSGSWRATLPKKSKARTALISLKKSEINLPKIKIIIVI